MKHSSQVSRVLFILALGVVFTSISWSPAKADGDGLDIIHPEELVKQLAASRSSQPLILNIGPRLLYAQAHIPGSEYVGAGSTPEGIERLRTRVQGRPHDSLIVLYCGCCPWDRCPNVRPAFKALRALGYTQIKLLYIANNFGEDWVNKGYPVTKSQ